MAMKIIEQTTNSLGIVIIKIDYSKIEALSKWCKKHQCGKRVAITRFAFTQEELTMFRLQWENLQ